MRGRGTPVRCAVCHDALAPVGVTACLRCGSAAHEDCRAELARCPTLACSPRIHCVMVPRRGSVRRDLAELALILGLLALVALAAVGAFEDSRRIDVVIQGG